MSLVVSHIYPQVHTGEYYSRSDMLQYIYSLHQEFMGILPGFLAPFVFARIGNTMRLTQHTPDKAINQLTVVYEYNTLEYKHYSYLLTSEQSSTRLLQIGRIQCLLSRLLIHDKTVERSITLNMIRHLKPP